MDDGHSKAIIFSSYHLCIASWDVLGHTGDLITLLCVRVGECVCVCVCVRERERGRERERERKREREGGRERSV